jgi:hypothetical protein
MLLLVHIERICAKSGKREESEAIGWLPGGKSFVIRDKDLFCSTWLPRFFSHAKFSSFTRKLYRWGFRKINPAVAVTERASAVVFSNEHFHRDNMELLQSMRSITAAKQRGGKSEAERSATDHYESCKGLAELSQGGTNQPPGFINGSNTFQPQTDGQPPRHLTSMLAAGLNNALLNGNNLMPQTYATDPYLLALARLSSMNSVHTQVQPQASTMLSQGLSSGQMAGTRIQYDQSPVEPDRNSAVAEMLLRNILRNMNQPSHPR